VTASPVAYPVHPADLPTSALRELLADGAECQYDPELHTGPDFTEEFAEERAAREEVARQVCASCSLRLECLEYALRIEPEEGVWAGYTADEIAVLAALQPLNPVA